MTTEGLKPCPFCGGGAVKYKENPPYKRARPYMAAGCMNEACAAQRWSLPIAAWNTRIDDELIDKLVEALKECKAQCDEDLESLADEALALADEWRGK